MTDSPEISVAYLVNLYPVVSHTFIRREILALEALGVTVHRYALQRDYHDLVDARDKAEQEKTRGVLDAGPAGLLLSTLATALRHPVRFARGIRDACALGSRSDRGVLRHLIYLVEACELKRRLARDGVSHLHAHFGTNPTAIALMCHTLGGPGYSFTAHGSAEYDRLDAIKIGMKIDRARFAVAVCQFGRSQLMRHCDRSQWDRIHIMHCGVEDELLDREVVPPPQTPQMVSVGRLSEVKGQLVLIEAMHLLRERGIAAHVTLVGDGPLRGVIEASIREFGLENDVTLAGWATGEQIREHLDAARALVMPSFVEGLPVVAMEAFARGRPVVGTYVGGVPELVRPGETGWLVQPGDADGLATALAEVVRMTPERLAGMGVAGRTLVESSHRSAHEAGNLRDLFVQYSTTER